MNRLVRQLLFMFGPLIFRQITKTMKKNNNTNQWNTPDSHRQQRRKPKQRPVKREVIDIEPVLSEEERNFNLDEKDIMLEEKDLIYVEDVNSTDVDGEFESDFA